MIQLLKDSKKKLKQTINGVHQRLFQMHRLKLALTVFAITMMINQFDIAQWLVKLIVLSIGIFIVCLLFSNPYGNKEEDEQDGQDNQQQTESKLRRLHKEMFEVHDLKYLFVIIALTIYLKQIDFVGQPILDGLVKIVIYIVVFLLFFKPRHQNEDHTK